MPTVRYFVLVDDRLEKVSQQRVFDAWNGQPWDKSRGDREVRLLEAVFTDAGKLFRVDFVRLTTHDGRITQEARQRAARAKQSGAEVDFAYHADGWPADWRQQIMVALDSPLTEVVFGLGGLLGVSLQLGIPVLDLLRQYGSALE